MTWPLTATGKRVISYAICPLFSYIICYQKAYRHFSGGGFSGDGFSTGEFLVGMETSEGELFRENFRLGEFARIHVQDSFYLSYFLIGNSILHVEMLWDIVIREKLSAE